MRAPRAVIIGGALLTLLGAVPPLDAQTVGGIVRDRRTSGVVENVTVTLLDVADSSVARTRSDSLGIFYLTAPAPGSYTLRFNLGAGPERTTPPIELASVETFHQNTYVVEVPADLYFWSFQVQKPVEAINNVAPSYPTRLEAEGITGEVTVQFVVDTLGRADIETLRVVESSHSEFFHAVRQALPRMRFRPAEIRDRKVRQLVQQAFAFKAPTIIPSMRPPRDDGWPPPLPPLPRTRPPQ